MTIVAPVETAERTPPPGLALAGVVVSITFWSLGPLFVKAVDASGAAIAAYRFGLAIPVMVLVARLTGGRITWSVLKRSALPGVLFGLCMISGFTSFQKTSVANATLVAALSPALVLLVAGRMFGERATRRQLVWSGLAFVGVLVVVTGKSGGGASGRTGDLLAVANLLIWTVYFLMMKRIRDAGVHTWALLASIFIWAGLLTIPFGFLASDDMGKIHGTDWWWLIGMVLLPGLVGHGTMTWAQRHVDITLASLLFLGNPVLSTLGAWIVYDEALSIQQGIGAAIVLAAMAAIVLEQRPGRKVVAEAEIGTAPT